MTGDGPGGFSKPAARVLRSTSGTVALIVSGVIAVVLLGDAVLRAGFAEMLLLAPWVLLVLWLVYVTMYASHIAIDGDGATVQNYLRLTRIPWARVSDIRMRWQVVFDVDDGSEVKAFGGPVAGRPGRDDRRARTRPSAAVPPALRELGLIKDQWQNPRQQPSADASIRRSWDVPALIALGVIIVWLISALLTTQS